MTARVMAPSVAQSQTGGEVGGGTQRRLVLCPTSPVRVLHDQFLNTEAIPKTLLPADHQPHHATGTMRPGTVGWDREVRFRAARWWRCALHLKRG